MRKESSDDNSRRCSTTRITTIIVAGGSGTRMGTETPKQFLLLGGLPVLMRTIEAMARNVNNYVNNFVVVLPPSEIDRWKELCREYDFQIEHRTAEGGENRFESVKSGLRFVQDSDIVVVHDGVRPFVDKETVRKAIECAEQNGCAVPVVEVIDSLRKVINNDSSVVDRASYRAVQTPQVFRREIITTAYEQPYDPMFTDDASVVESAGRRIFLTRGHHANIKITTPADLAYGNFVFNEKI